MSSNQNITRVKLIDCQNWKDESNLVWQINLKHSVNYLRKYCFSRLSFYYSLLIWKYSMKAICTTYPKVCILFLGSFTLADSDSDTKTNSAKFYCEQVSLSVDTSRQLYTSHLLLGPSVGLGLVQCKHTIIPTQCQRLIYLWLRTSLSRRKFSST